MNASFLGKKILVGVTGGIAAYKAAFLVRELRKRDAQVRVMMTEAATKFVTPLTFETLAESPVAVELFGDAYTFAAAHIEWARWPDVIVICPASANTIAKVAHGFADNMLATTVLASKSPVVFCPAMNVEMFNNPLYRANEEILRQAGYTIVPPGTGELACGETGAGRLAEISDILAALYFQLYSSKSLAGKLILVTAGPTREPIDPVRYISNRSSGKMGYALAESAALRGADVTLISGPTCLTPCSRIHFVRVNTATEMAEQVKKALSLSDVFIMTAAVADFRPVDYSDQKLKKTNASFSLDIEPTPDILALAAPDKKSRIHVGFALETENGLENAKNKLSSKGCDLMVLNGALEAGAGFEVDTNKVTLLNKAGEQRALPLMSKWETAQEILNEVERLITRDMKKQ
jgi:phosphopantothenoylcysteine decarboxylase / phosphopantothenate---cysteine ligase